MINRAAIIAVFVLGAILSAHGQSVISSPQESCIENLRTIHELIDKGEGRRALDLLKEYDRSPEELRAMGITSMDRKYFAYLSGECHFMNEDYQEALRSFKKAEDIYNSIGVITDVTILTVYDRIVDCYLEIDQPDMALEYEKKNLRKTMRLTGNFSKEKAKVHKTLSTIYLLQGNIPSACTELSKYIEIMMGGGYYEQDLNGIVDDMLLYCSLAYQLNQIEQPLETVRVLEEGLDEYDYGSPQHLRACLLLTQLYSLTDAELAIRFAEKAISIASMRLDETEVDSDILIAFNNYVTFCIPDDSEAAVEILEELAETTAVAGSAQNLLRGILLNNIGAHKMDELEVASAYFREAFDIIIGSRNSDVSNILLSGLNLAICLWEQSEYGELKDVLSRLNSVLTERLIGSFANMTEANRSRYWEQVKEWYQIILPEFAVRLDTPEMWSLLYDCLLQSRSILLSSTISVKQQIDSSEDPLLKKLYLQMTEIGELEEADGISEKLEARLIEELARHGNFMNRFDITRDDVSRTLNPGEIAVEFVRYDPGNFDALFPALNFSSTVPENHPKETTYLALIDRCDSKSPEVVTLCTEQAFKKWDLQTLYDNIWRPLESSLGGIGTIYFSPDGRLFSLPIEYALDVRGKGIWEKFNLHRLSSTRELLNSHNDIGTKSVALFGGMKYDLSTEMMEKDSEKYQERGEVTESIARERGDRALLRRLKPLPGTLKEVETIKKTLTGLGENGMMVNLYTDSIATEAAFKSYSGKSPAILHVATHGFYNKTNEKTPEETIGATHKSYEQETLSHSGLLFSGADNVRFRESIPPEVEDGVLDAYEISGLDLHGTDMVVLSACRTALGEVSGDGVFGLQRGLKKAGVNSILMTLWNVDDEATTYFMTEFYKNLIDNKERKDAKQISIGKARDAVRAVPKWEDYHYWAPFILLDGISAKEP